MSKIEVDAIEPQSGTTLTLGASGDSVNIASGATITDFTSTGIDDNATSTAITIDSSENVGIGTASPGQKLDIGSGTLRIKNASGDSSGLMLFQDTGDVSVMNNYYAGAIAFQVNSTEYMRITSAGNLGIGTTSPSSSYRLSVVGGTGAVVGAFIETTSTDSGHEASIIKRPNSGVLVQFLGSGQVGSITTNGSSTTYATSSDYRLKENVVEIENATARLKQLQPKRFNFIADADTTVDGFIAHEVSSIVPEAISGTKDAMRTEEYEVTPAVLDENGNVITEAVMGTKVVPVYQGIDQAKLVPLLVKTIQELEARITTLENK